MDREAEPAPRAAGTCTHRRALAGTDGRQAIVVIRENLRKPRLMAENSLHQFVRSRFAYEPGQLCNRCVGRQRKGHPVRAVPPRDRRSHRVAGDRPADQTVLPVVRRTLAVTAGDGAAGQLPATLFRPLRPRGQRSVVQQPITRASTEIDATHLS